MSGSGEQQDQQPQQKRPGLLARRVIIGSIPVALFLFAAIGAASDVFGLLDRWPGRAPTTSGPSSSLSPSPSSGASPSPSPSPMPPTSTSVPPGGGVKPGPQKSVPHPHGTHNNGYLSIIPDDATDNSVDLEDSSKDPLSRTDLRLSGGSGEFLQGANGAGLAMIPSGAAEAYETCEQVSWKAQIRSNDIDPSPDVDNAVFAKMCIRTDRGRLGIVTFDEGRNLSIADNSFHFAYVIWEN